MHDQTFLLWLRLLTSYLGLQDKQLSTLRGRKSCEEREEEKEGWALFGGISSRQVTHVNSKIKYIFILFLPGTYIFLINRDYSGLVLVAFYGISTIVGYLMLNSVFTYISNKWFVNRFWRHTQS